MHRSILLCLMLVSLPFSADAQFIDEAAARRAQNRRNHERYEVDAKKHGFNHYYTSIADMMESFRLGGFTVATAQEYLVVRTTKDDFVVDSTSRKYIFYVMESYGADPIYIAVLRRDGELYVEGSGLTDPYYRVVGAASVQTVMGKEVDIVVFEGIK